MKTVHDGSDGVQSMPIPPLAVGQNLRPCCSERPDEGPGGMNTGSTPGLQCHRNTARNEAAMAAMSRSPTTVQSRRRSGFLGRPWPNSRATKSL